MQNPPKLIEDIDREIRRRAESRESSDSLMLKWVPQITLLEREENYHSSSLFQADVAEFTILSKRMFCFSGKDRNRNQSKNGCSVTPSLSRGGALTCLYCDLLPSWTVKVTEMEKERTIAPLYSQGDFSKSRLVRCPPKLEDTHDQNDWKNGNFETPPNSKEISLNCFYYNLKVQMTELREDLYSLDFKYSSSNCALCDLLPS